MRTHFLHAPHRGAVSPAAAVGGGGEFNDDGFYVSTYEPVDANILKADDFMRADPGDSVGPSWYNKDCDQANSSGGLFQDGCHSWCGTIYNNPITPTNAVRTGGVGVGGKEICATHGVTSGGAGGRNMADTNLAEEVAELWVRFYTKPLAGYSFGAEKVLTFNRYNEGGIYFGNLHWNLGAGSASSSGNLRFQTVAASPEDSPQTNFNLEDDGHWYFIEVHAKLGSGHFSSDGAIEIWADDMGTDGVSGPSSPTLRFSDTSWSGWPRQSGDLFGNLWWENWANPGSTGERYLDLVKVSKSGPIGFQTTW